MQLILKDKQNNNVKLGIGNRIFPTDLISTESSRNNNNTNNSLGCNKRCTQDVAKKKKKSVFIYIQGSSSSVFLVPAKPATPEPNGKVVN